MLAIAIVGQLSDGDAHLLGCRAIIVGPECRWTGARFGTTATVYREGLHLLDEGVAVVAGASAEEMIAQVKECPYPTLLVAFWGSPKGRAWKALEAAVDARQGAKLFKVTSTFGAWMEAGGGACYYLGGMMEEPALEPSEEPPPVVEA